MPLLSNLNRGNESIIGETGSTRYKVHLLDINGISAKENIRGRLKTYQRQIKRFLKICRSAVWNAKMFKKDGGV
jgi:hypothetical protein